MERIPLTTQGVIALYYEQRPKVFWRVGKDRLPELHKLKDDDNRYLWREEGLHGQAETLLGVPIRAVEGDVFELAVEK